VHASGTNWYDQFVRKRASWEGIIIRNDGTKLITAGRLLLDHALFAQVFDRFGVIAELAEPRLGVLGKSGRGSVG
jgi:hypothetical protein